MTNERSEAGKKAWETMREREAEMSEDDLAELKKKRSRASNKAWSRRKWNKMMTVRAKIRKQRNGDDKT